MVLEQVNLSA